MARWRRSNSRQFGPQPLLASAVLVKQSQLRTVPDMREWQGRAWEYYDTVGELRFACQWISNALSRCRLYVGVPDDDGGDPDPLGDEDITGADERARIPLDELFGGSAGHPEMLARLAMHLTVPGESYLIGFDEADGRRRWITASSEEFTRTGNTLRVRLPESDVQHAIKLAESTIIRLWRPHPRRAWEADSPVRAALGVLKELVDVGAHITATLESRLAGAGVWILPESATLPSPLGQQGDSLHADPAMSTLIDAMVTPLGDRDSAAAVVPIIVRVPESAAGKSEYLTFSTKLDEKIQELRAANIRRFATIVDIPAEVLTGVASGDISHWGMWKVSEDAIKLHIEPLLGLICEALTTQYLWPALEAIGVADPERYVIWYDSSDLVQRPNRGPEAQNLHERRLVKDATVRRANGFSDDDAPSEEEAQRHLLVQLAERGVDPFVVSPYLKALGITLELPQPEPGQGEDDGKTDGPGTRQMGRPPLPVTLPTRPEPLPGDPDTVGRDLPVVASLRGQDEIAFAVIEFGALHALSRAGKRLLNGTNREWRGRLRRVEPWAIHTQIPVADLDDALHGAYDELRACLPGHPRLHQVIDAYVRDRLCSQRPHDKSALMSMVARVDCLPLGGGSRAIA